MAVTASTASQETLRTCLVVTSSASLVSVVEPAIEQGRNLLVPPPELLPLRPVNVTQVGLSGFGHLSPVGLETAGLILDHIGQRALALPSLGGLVGQQPSETVMVQFVLLAQVGQQPAVPRGEDSNLLSHGHGAIAVLTRSRYDRAATGALVSHAGPAL